VSGLDLFEDGFPHGTKEGFEQGCKGGACPAAVEGGMTCNQANIRYQGDYGYRKLVDSGATAGEIASHDAALTIRTKAVRDAGKATEKRALKVAEPERAPVSTPIGGPKSADVGAQVKQPDPEHGISSRYQKGCKTDEACPNYGTSAITCAQAKRDYNRAYAAKRKAALPAVAPVVPAAAPVVTDLAPGTPVPAAELSETAVTSVLATDVDVLVPHLPEVAPQIDSSDGVFITIDPTPGGGVHFRITGTTRPIDVALTFAAHGLEHVTITEAAA